MIFMKTFEKRWFMWDYARLRRFNREEFLLVADKLKELGYNGIGLYLEGAFDFKSIDGILRDGVMTYEDAKWAKAECEKRGIFLFPMTNVVGHMEHFLRQERFKHLRVSPEATTYDVAFQRPEAEEFAMQIIHEYLDAFDLKYIHIGGDEVKLTDANKPIYAKFLAKLCDNLLAEGVTPGVWNDLIWAHPELCEPFSRDVEIFDWSYHGHRKGSVELFINEGFKNIYACPCENSWVGFINHQYESKWAGGDGIHVEPDEIEAFLSDFIENEKCTSPKALITHWEASQGRDLWGQWSALARAGLYMTGNLKYQEQNDEKIERAIFGRVTPYTEIARILREEIQCQVAIPGKTTITQLAFIRKTLFLPATFKEILYKASCGSEIKGYNEVYVASCGLHIDRDAIFAAIDKAEAKLKTWVPQNAFEERCFISMTSILSMTRAAFALHKAAANCEKYYTEAAKVQFTDPKKAKELVYKFSEGFKIAAENIKTYKVDIARLISVSGHTDTDLVRLDYTLELINKLTNFLESTANDEKFSRIPLPAFQYVLEYVVDNSILAR